MTLVTLNQRKIDLAVLLKMFQDAAGDGWWVTRHDIKRMFTVPVPMRFIEAATEKLFDDGDIVRDYDPLNFEESRWQLSRKGIEKVQRAMKVPTSFTARLAKNGDSCLESEEARAAVLKKLPDQKPTSLGTTPQTTEPELEPITPSITIHNTFSPSSSQSNSSQPLDGSSGRSAASASWISAWGTWAAVIVAVVAIVVTLKLAGKI